MKRILILCMLLLLTGCDSDIVVALKDPSPKVIEEVTYEYSDFNSLNDYNEVLSQDSSYLVYYYNITCGACARIKDTVLEFAADNTTEYNFYLLHSPDVTGDRQTILFEGESLASTPTLMVIENGVIIGFYNGTIEIGDYLDSLINQEVTE